MRTEETSLFQGGMTRACAALLGAASLLAFAAPALAQAPESKTPEHHEWSFQGPTGTFDRAALQRGYQVYREVCSTCHSMKFMSFRNLGDDGGPFFDKEHSSSGDNPVIKALAAEFTISDGPDSSGQMFDRPGRPSDPFPHPFPNEQMARLANGGALPPDLSVIVKARKGGPDYVRALLTGYQPAPAGVTVPPGSQYNPYFPGGQLKMPPPLPEGRVTFADGTPNTNAQMAQDVVTFLSWVSDPHTEARKRTGIAVIGYLIGLTALLWITYKRVWRGVKH
jgi:cytochrome c1